MAVNILIFYLYGQTELLVTNQQLRPWQCLRDHSKMNGFYDFKSWVGIGGKYQPYSANMNRKVHHDFECWPEIFHQSLLNCNRVKERPHPIAPI